MHVREPALYDEDRARGVRSNSEAFRCVQKRLGQKRPETAETVLVTVVWPVSLPSSLGVLFSMTSSDPDRPRLAPLLADDSQDYL